MFAYGHRYYLISVIPNPEDIDTVQPVEETVIVDAESGIVVARFNRADPNADANVRTFFNGRS